MCLNSTEIGCVRARSQVKIYICKIYLNAKTRERNSKLSTKPKSQLQELNVLNSERGLISVRILHVVHIRHDELIRKSDKESGHARTKARRRKKSGCQHQFNIHYWPPILIGNTLITVIFFLLFKIISMSRLDTAYICRGCNIYVVIRRFSRVVISVCSETIDV